MIEVADSNTLKGVKYAISENQIKNVLKTIIFIIDLSSSSESVTQLLTQLEDDDEGHDGDEQSKDANDGVKTIQTLINNLSEYFVFWEAVDIPTLLPALDTKVTIIT